MTSNYTLYPFASAYRTRLDLGMCPTDLICIRHIPYSYPMMIPRVRTPLPQIMTSDAALKIFYLVPSTALTSHHVGPPVNRTSTSQSAFLSPSKLAVLSRQHPHRTTPVNMVLLRLPCRSTVLLLVGHLLSLQRWIWRVVSPADDQ